MGAEFSFYVIPEVLPRVPGSRRSLDQDDSAASMCKVAEVCALGNLRSVWLDLPHSVRLLLLGNSFSSAPMPGLLSTCVTLSSGASCQPGPVCLFGCPAPVSLHWPPLQANPTSHVLLLPMKSQVCLCAHPPPPMCCMQQQTLPSASSAKSCSNCRGQRAGQS